MWDRPSCSLRTDDAQRAGRESGVPVEIAAPDPDHRPQTGHHRRGDLVAGIGVADVHGVGAVGAVIGGTLTGFIGRMFGVMRPHAAPPAPGAQPPPLWGDASHVGALLGDRVTDFVTERHSLLVYTFTDDAHFLEFFKSRYGPTIATYARVADDADAVAALDDGLTAWPTSSPPLRPRT